MNPAINRLITDVKAAARIGHPASLEAALNGLQQFPEVAANSPMEEEFLRQVILPIGDILTASRFESSAFQPFLKDPAVSLRAIAGVVFSERFVDAPSTHRILLDRLAADLRSDVRRAVALALIPAAIEDQPAVFSLVDEWLGTSSPRLQLTALMVFPHFSPAALKERLPALIPLHTATDPDLRAVLGDALIQIAQKGLAADVFSILEQWSHHEPPNSWVITRALSSSWAAADPARSLEILHTLALSAVEPRRLTAVIKALIRHGAAEAVNRELPRWSSIENPALIARLDSLVPDDE